LLIKYGADVNLKDMYGQTCIYYAILSGKVEIVEFLLDNKADISIQDNKMLTPYQFASKNKQKKIAEILKNRQGVFPNFPTIENLISPSKSISQASPGEDLLLCTPGFRMLPKIKSPAKKSTRANSPTYSTRARSPTKRSQANCITNVAAKIKSPAKQPKAKSPTYSTRSISHTYTTKAKSPSKQSKANSPIYPTKAKSPTYTTKAKSPTYSTKAKSPTYSTKAKSPTYTSKAKSPTYTTKAKSPTYTTKAKSPTYTTKAKSPTKTPCKTISSGKSKPALVKKCMIKLTEDDGNSDRLMDFLELENTIDSFKEIKEILLSTDNFGSKENANINKLTTTAESLINFTQENKINIGLRAKLYILLVNFLLI
jgi:hypothetical protein